MVATAIRVLVAKKGMGNVSSWNRLLTHFLNVEQTLITNPLTLSDLREDSTRVEPGSLGASKATHSSRPSFSEAKDSWSDSRSHWSSRS
jgi:hypothetical protein